MTKQLRTVASITVLALSASLFVRMGDAAATPSNINLSAAAGSQAEAAIAINPANPNQIFAVAMDENLAGGFVAARSSDGGATWTRGKVGTSVPQAIADPSVSWDAFGNLFLSYLGKATNNPQVLDISTDGGATFTHLASVGSQADQPTVTTGPSGTPGTGSVWVSWSGFGGMFVSGAPVTGLGAVGKFGPAQAIAGSTGLSFGDIAVGPGGAVMTSFGPASGSTGGTIYTSTSAGLGQAFSEAQPATTTGVGGFEPIPAQPSRGIDSESGLAYNRTGGSHQGRVYLMYTDANPAGSADTNIYVRHSDDNGASWSSAVRVNDDLGTASQFLPRLALDPTSGDIGVSWYDTRNDPLNVKTELFAAFSTDGGASFTPNAQISSGSSSESGADPPPVGYPDLDYGDYTGSSFLAGKLFPIWTDNSNSTADNPDGTLAAFDIYTAAVPSPAVSSPPTIVTGAASAVTSTSATLNATVDPDGASVSDCHFDYGTTVAYGSSAPCDSLPGSGESAVAVTASLTGLSASTTYHFRVVATSPGGTSYGADQKLATLGPPEYGRCLKVPAEARGAKPVYHGGFTSANCSVPSAGHTGKYEWYPGVVRPHFTTRLAEGFATLKTVNGLKVTCAGETGAGEFSGVREVANLIVTFTGCARSGEPCTGTSAATGEVTTDPLEGILGVIGTTSAGGRLTKSIGLDVFPSGRAGPLATFACGTSTVTVTGSVIAAVRTNVMDLTSTLRYKASQGRQKPESFEGQQADVLETSFAGGAPEQSGLTMTVMQTDEEAIEINASV
jgi:hypothetical protein